MTRSRAAIEEIIAVARDYAAQYLDPKDDIAKIRNVEAILRDTEVESGAARNKAKTLLAETSQRHALLQTSRPTHPSSADHLERVRALTSEANQLSSGVAHLEGDVGSLKSRLESLGQRMAQLAKDLDNEEEEAVDPAVLKLRIYKDLGFTLSSSQPPSADNTPPKFDRVTVISRSATGTDVNTFDLNDGRSRWNRAQVLWELAGGWTGK
ncbi:hypothetical protein M427DRAFT_53710 [Gonapodya prolifera JEL478]|uniref:Kinetochore protein Spc24 n=1 Tax=Gonapodya prolifera (strain JEL478) TaxID=1344416 RepID=A0A139ANH6_GONPJ|nr:hypothetical protein M427DRAFT_53710 [Gonapodya prolifera JEL478]|eukprot:KXS18311.1 hypothetical protein M427DRAFT_53710 [Gonapodya prolifera JEL478]